jgi:hypothetical protein
LSDNTPATSYRGGSIVRLGSALELTKLNINGDICDDNPCTGNYRYFYEHEKGKDIADIDLGHVHDPEKPLTPPESPES